MTGQTSLTASDLGESSAPPPLISIVIISKNEPALRETLSDVLASAARSARTEVIVIDASSGRLEAIREDFPEVRWVDFDARPGTVSIPHQRNEGIRQASRPDIVVFTDAGCHVGPEWLSALTAPILRGEEELAAGVTEGSGAWGFLYERDPEKLPTYLDEAPTINLALSRRVIETVGEFDERFEYGSDIDFTWRAVKSGFRIRLVPEAVVVHDWGTRQRQMRRSYRYGKARARLHRKHGTPLLEVVRRDPVAVVYPAFLLGLPLTILFPPYPLLLLVPAWRARRSRPLVVVLDHLVYGAGALAEVLR